LRGQLQKHSIVTHTELSSGLPLVVVHESQLQQVLFNLIQNAMEAMNSTTDRIRELRVNTRFRDRGAISLTVQDFGPGIDPKQLDGIFDAFVTTKAHGIGLGLAICRMIVERHGGQLTASSDGKSGASFEIILPIESTDRDLAEDLN
jgi:signal transduction histidine kinase